MSLLEFHSWRDIDADHKFGAERNGFLRAH